MKLFQYLSILVLSCVVAFGTARYMAPQSQNGVVEKEVSKKETRWEQIKKRGVLRCGYFVWPPFYTKEADGKMTGIGPEVMEAIAKQLELKLEWTEEIDFGHMFAGYNRYDMVCAPLTPNGNRARETAFTRDYIYIGLYGFVRADDTRFDKGIESINDPAVRISLIDGEYSSIIAAEDFPRAQPVAVTQMGNGAQMILQVATGKADVGIADPFSLQSYMDNNPGKIKLLPIGNPLRVLSGANTLPHDEPAFKDAFDAAINNLEQIGALDSIYRKHEKGIAKVIRLAKPYQE